jgi:hypothetical protein
VEGSVDGVGEAEEEEELCQWWSSGATPKQRPDAQATGDQRRQLAGLGKRWSSEAREIQDVQEVQWASVGAQGKLLARMSTLLVLGAVECGPEGANLLFPARRGDAMR